MKQINIVSSTNNKYVNYLIPLIFSVLENTPNTKINFHVLFENLSESNQSLILKKTEKFSENCKVKFFKIEKKLFEKAVLETYTQSSYEAYSRLLIPNILVDLDKVIYLDADIIVLKDLNLLNEIEIDNHEIAAVEDYNPNSQVLFKKIFDLKNVNSYFNSGILIMNLQKLRQGSFTENSLKLILETHAKYRFFDQDILNFYFSEKYLKLDPRWNVQLYLELATSNFRHTTLNKKEYDDCKNNPFIVHYTIVKPDYLNYFFKYKNIYKSYLKKSGIKFSYKKTSLKQIVWSTSEILFFKIINLLNLHTRNKLLNYFRKFF